ncbi:MAG: hypothetical protein R3D45_02140 [Rhizobiaceae bacterium]
MLKRMAAATLIGSFAAWPAAADDGRYQLETSKDGFVRLDTETGEMSICAKQGSQLVCRAAAEERAAFQEEIDRLDRTIEALEKRIAMLESGSRPGNELPSDEEFERTLGFMEKFMRRFMDIIENFDRTPGGGQAPDRT